MEPESQPPTANLSFWWPAKPAGQVAYFILLLAAFVVGFYLVPYRIWEFGAVPIPCGFLPALVNTVVFYYIAMILRWTVLLIRGQADRHAAWITIWHIIHVLLFLVFLATLIYLVIYYDWHQSPRWSLIPIY